MKKKVSLFSLFGCAILATALLLSVFALIRAKSEVKAASEQVQVLMERVQALEEHNQTLQAQLDAQIAAQTPDRAEIDKEDFYCTLMVDTWAKEDDVLTVNTFAQAVLAEGISFNAQIELWRGDAVLASQPILLDIGEADGIFEADVTASFPIPEIGADEELQLWLMVEPVGGDALFACGAGWYLEDGQLMLITG